MPVLARQLRDTNAALSVVVDKVRGRVYEKDQRQQCETVNRLNVYSNSTLGDKANFLWTE